MITINKWDDTYEHAESRKRKALNWFACPVGLQSTGYIALSSIKGGFEAFGVFQALCQLHATNEAKSVRLLGTLSRSDGRPMTVQIIANILRIEKDVLENALKILSSDDVNWISFKMGKKSEQIQNLPPSPDDFLPSPDDLPPSPDDLPQGTCYRHTDIQDIQTNKQKESQTNDTSEKEEVGFFLRELVQKVCKQYNAHPDRLSEEAKRSLWMAHQKAPFTDHDVDLVCKYVMKHKAGKLGKQPHIPQSASRAIENFSELLERAQSIDWKLKPKKEKPKLAPVLPEPEDLTPEQLAAIKAETEKLKNKIKNNL